jgi:hypothetical protein
LPTLQILNLPAFTTAWSNLSLSLSHTHTKHTILWIALINTTPLKSKDVLPWHSLQFDVRVDICSWLGEGVACSLQLQSQGDKTTGKTNRRHRRKYNVRWQPYLNSTSNLYSSLPLKSPF